MCIHTYIHMYTDVRAGHQCKNQQIKAPAAKRSHTYHILHIYLCLHSYNRNSVNEYLIKKSKNKIKINANNLFGKKDVSINICMHCIT